VNGVGPAAGEIGRRGKVLGSGQHGGLEPTDGARRGSTAFDRPATDELTHHRVAAQPVRVVDALVASEAREQRLAQEPGKVVSAVPADTRIGKATRGKIGKPEGVVQLSVQEQSAVGADRGTAERRLDRAVELEPQGPRFLFTHRVRCRHAAPSSLTRCHHEDITARFWLDARSIWDMRDQKDPGSRPGPPDGPNPDRLWCKNRTSNLSADLPCSAIVATLEDQACSNPDRGLPSSEDSVRQGPPSTTGVFGGRRADQIWNDVRSLRTASCGAGRIGRSAGCRAADAFHQCPRLRPGERGPNRERQ
jgi:hypothetical protein